MKKNSSKLTKGIVLLPNLLTLTAMFSGFYAMIASMQSHFYTSIFALYIAMVFDFFDGRIARLTQTQTEFGAQFDSLSDLLCFGAAPSLLLYSWSLHALGKIGWLIAFMYAVCTALRLAQFNTQKQNKRYFYGLSTPAAAALSMSLVWVSLNEQIQGIHISGWLGFFAVIVALLKVSFIPYRSFKDIDWKGHVPFLAVLSAMIVLILVAIDPPHVLLACFSLYALSGPAIWIWRKAIKYVRLKKRTPSP